MPAPNEETYNVNNPGGNNTIPPNALGGPEYVPNNAPGGANDTSNRQVTPPAATPAKTGLFANIKPMYYYIGGGLVLAILIYVAVKNKWF